MKILNILKKIDIKFPKVVGRFSQKGTPFLHCLQTVSCINGMSGKLRNNTFKKLVVLGNNYFEKRI